MLVTRLLWGTALRTRDGDTSQGPTSLRLGEHVLVICYTDGLSDATDDRGVELGVDGLLELSRGLPTDSQWLRGRPCLAGSMLSATVHLRRMTKLSLS